jgi:pimeloyl-ACP methyl ester carboxylesterase
VDEQQIDLDGQQITYTHSKGAGRPVIFVHGNSCSLRTWGEIMTGPFGQQFRCLAFDLPGHGSSAPAARSQDYSLPGYAATLAAFTEAMNATDAVIVGWSLGGHIALDASPALPAAAGYVIYGTPPVSSPAQLGEAFLPNPAMNIGFTASVGPAEAEAYAASFTAGRSELLIEEFTADILRTDGAARAGLFASISEGRFADEVAIVAALPMPLAILHGEHEALINLAYLQQLKIPTLWRGRVQLVPGAAHAIHRETPEAFTGLLTQFIADIG